MRAMTPHPALDALIDDFAFLDSWEDRYMHVIDLGRELEPLENSERTEANKVQGCASQVWLVSERDGDTLRFRGDSDAHIVRGLVAVVLAALSGRTRADILATDMEAVMARLGLSEHLSSQRANGLRSMVARIRAEAAASVAKT